MKKKISTIFCFIAVALILIFLIFGMSGCIFSEDARIKKYINKKFGLGLSKNDTVLYTADDIGWMGDGMFYYVVQFENEPTELLNKKGFYISKYAMSIEEDRKEYKNNLQIKLKKLFKVASKDFDTVPDEYRPDWGSNFLYVGGLEDSVEVQDRCYYYNIESRNMIIWGIIT